MSNIICIANLREKTGRTCTAVNFAASLSLLDKRVLLVDCDASGQASACLGFGKGSYEFGLDDFFIGIVGARAVVKKTMLDGLDLIPAGGSLADIETHLAYNPDKDKVLSIILRKFRESYDVIIFDTPADQGLLTRSAMVASDSLLIPALLAPDTLDDLNRLLVFASNARKGMDAPLKISGIVFMNCQSSDHVGSYYSNGELKNFRHAVFPVTIPEKPADMSWDTMARPMCLKDIKSPLAEAFLDLSYEFLYREKVQ